MQRKRHLSGCRDEREVGCRRKAECAQAVGANLPCSLTLPPECEVEMDYCPVNLTPTKDVEMDSITCKLCCHCIYQPTGLPCGHYFCNGCITDHLVTSNTCPTCMAPASCLCAAQDVEDAVASVFPYFNALRQKLQLAMEKRMFVELFKVRARLTDLRGVFHKMRGEREAALQELKLAFYNFYECHAEEVRLTKEYCQGVKALKEQNTLGNIIGMRRAPSGDKEDLPTACCCLETMITSLDALLLRNPSDWSDSYDRCLHSGVNLASPLTVKCRCGADVKLMPGAVPSYYNPVESIEMEERKGAVPILPY